MAPSPEETDLQAHKLDGKHNYIRFRRHFDRVLKKKDLWQLANGKVKITDEPQMDDYNVVIKTENGAVVTDSALTVAKFNVAYEKWKKSRAQLKELREILFDSISVAITIELEDYKDGILMDDPLKALTYIAKMYGTSHERARQQLLEEVDQLKLWKCSSMLQYINKHRELKSDLIKAGHSGYTDGVMITNILNGLGRDYSDFREQWDWVRAANMDDAPNMSFLQERLLIKEENLNKNKTNKDGKKGNRQSGNQRGRASNDKTCTWPECGMKGHNADECWKHNPNLKPQWAKDRDAKRNDKNSSSNNKDSPKESPGDNSDNKSSKPKKLAAAVMVDQKKLKQHMQTAAAQTARIAVFDHSDFTDTIKRTVTYQANNPFAILDTPLGASHTHQGMEQDLKAGEEPFDHSQPMHHHHPASTSKKDLPNNIANMESTGMDGVFYHFAAVDTVTHTTHMYLSTKDIVVPPTLSRDDGTNEQLAIFKCAAKGLILHKQPLVFIYTTQPDPVEWKIPQTALLRTAQKYVKDKIKNKELVLRPRLTKTIYGTHDQNEHFQALLAKSGIKIHLDDVIITPDIVNEQALTDGTELNTFLKAVDELQNTTILSTFAINKVYTTLDNDEHEVVHIYTCLTAALNDEWGPYDKITIKTLLPNTATWPASDKYLYKRAKEEIIEALSKSYPKVELKAIVASGSDDDNGKPLEAPGAKNISK
ncbi:hypothetical protein N8I77_011637 [Diaporthe amygdali]|uniref:Uncharacterized protein n=1 Tax=Phomopsis amygdali TaxID=1214568 RepID=A0AAD9S397_PHOAM|nr:hypothetical protein N8I77_011637 [Diaporthe amygdali]